MSKLSFFVYPFGSITESAVHLLPYMYLRTQSNVARSDITRHIIYFSTRDSVLEDVKNTCL